MTSSFKRQLAIGFITALLGTLIIGYWFDWGSSGSVKNRNHLYQQLLERSGQLNRDLPKLLDTQTRFERAEVIDYGMRFIYRLVGANRYQHDVSSIQEQIEPEMLRQFCQHEALKFYREQADFLVIRYLDQNEAQLFELRFTRQDCV